MFEDHPHFAIFPGEGVEVMPVMPIVSKPNVRRAHRLVSDASQAYRLPIWTHVIRHAGSHGGAKHQICAVLGVPGCLLFLAACSSGGGGGSGMTASTGGGTPASNTGSTNTSGSSSGTGASSSTNATITAPGNATFGGNSPNVASGATPNFTPASAPPARPGFNVCPVGARGDIHHRGGCKCRWWHPHNPSYRAQQIRLRSF